MFLFFFLLVLLVWDVDFAAVTAAQYFPLGNCISDVDINFPLSRWWHGSEEFFVLRRLATVALLIQRSQVASLFALKEQQDLWNHNRVQVNIVHSNAQEFVLNTALLKSTMPFLWVETPTVYALTSNIITENYEINVLVLVYPCRKRVCLYC